MANTVTLRIGNSQDGLRPAKAKLREFRAGRGPITDISYKTLDLKRFAESFPAGETHTTTAIKTYMEREGETRMTFWADMFVPMTLPTFNHWYSRQQIDTYTPEVSNYRNFGQGEDKNDEVGLHFKLTSLSNTTKEVWFDNALFHVSGILWEFNQNGGYGRWYPLYMIPSSQYTRVTFPESANRVRLRAYSNDPDEWVQGIVVKPKVDYQIKDRVLKQPTNIHSDGFGNIIWNPSVGGIGQIRYYVYTRSTDDDPWTYLGCTYECRLYAVRGGDVETAYLLAGAGYVEQETLHLNDGSVEEETLHITAQVSDIPYEGQFRVLARDVTMEAPTDAVLQANVYNLYF